MSSSAHGSSNRGLAAGAMPGVGFGRFGHMFDPAVVPPATKLPEEGLKALAQAMIKEDDGAPISEREVTDENPTIPAGYTYFGQFVDHDITFDPTPLGASEVDTDALIDFRSPALDLDNVYGRGPDDQPYLYDGLRLRVGEAPGAGDAKIGTRADLFRLAEGGGIPLLGDKRNDENKIVSQFHGAIIQLHNKVVCDNKLLESFGADLSSPTARFRAATKIVRWHYQWVVLHDYLNRICAPDTVREILNPGGTPRLQNYLKADAKYPYMPIEFAGAAFRLGHSMVRPSYSLNSIVLTREGGDPAKERIPTFSRGAGARDNLNGFPGTLPREWGLDFGFFLELTAGAPAGNGFALPQPSYRIDALLVSPLANLPEFFQATDASQAGSSLVGNLAFRNLQRGQMLGLPSGQAVAKALGFEPLSDEILWRAGSRLRDRVKAEDEVVKALEETDELRRPIVSDWVKGNGGILSGNAPLWYYVLREAEWFGVERAQDEPGAALGGQHLGPVGSRIVGETFVGLLWLDKGSFLHDLRGFKPLEAISGGQELTLARLIEYALT